MQEEQQEAVKEGGKKDKKKKGQAAGGEEEDLDALLAEFGVNAEAAAGNKDAICKYSKKMRKKHACSLLNKEV